MDDKEKNLYKGKTIDNAGEAMVNMTFSLPDEVHRRMKKYPEIKWSALARAAIINYLDKLEMMDDILKDSKLKDKDVLELDRMIKRSMAERIRKEAPTGTQKKKSKRKRGRSDEGNS